MPFPRCLLVLTLVHSPGSKGQSCHFSICYLNIHCLLVIFLVCSFAISRHRIFSFGSRYLTQLQSLTKWVLFSTLFFMKSRHFIFSDISLQSSLPQTLSLLSLSLQSTLLVQRSSLQEHHPYHSISKVVSILKPIFYIQPTDSRACHRNLDRHHQGLLNNTLLVFDFVF